MTNDFANIRPARAEDLLRIAEIEIFNYRLNFYPIFRSDAYYFGEKTVPNLMAFYANEPGVIENTVVYDDGVLKGFIRVKDGEIE
jgi:putative acetyltransferase